MIILKIFYTLLSLKTCFGVLYHLNDSEYDHMPPIYDLDKYESCLQKDKGVYCTGKFEIFADQPNELMTLINEFSAHTAKHYNHSLIERGVCISKRCPNLLKIRNIEETDDLKDVLEACVNESIWNEYGLQAKVIDKYACDRQGEVLEKDIYDQIFLFIIVILVMLNVVGSIIDVYEQRQHREKNNNYGIKYYLLCFSILRNWKSLLSTDSEGDPRLRKLRGLHGVKCIVMYLFIVGHVFYLFHAFIDNTHQFEKFYEYTFYRMLFNGMVSVQILFTISGFLLAYHLLLESEKRPITWKLVPQIIIQRLWRISSANVLFVLFSATLIRHWGSGPLWKSYINNKMSGDCRKYWWSHLIFINNYISDNKFCVVQNWQLAADVQLFILGLCVFVGTKTRGRLMMMGLLMLLGMASLALHIWWNDLDAYMLLIPEIYRTFDLKSYEVHKYTHVNIPGFIIGMMTGQVLYHMQKRQVDISKYKNTLNMISHAMIPLIMVLFYSGSYFYEDAERASLGVRIAYGVAYRPTMSLLTAFIIVAMAMRFSDFWCDLLEWEGWVVPGKLTYSVSLIHVFYIIILFGSRTQLLQLTALNHGLAHVGVAVLSYLTAIPYCLLVEAPLNRVMKAIANGNVHAKKAD
ncbi:nose resistant to fluoxetine protein 6-like [Pectinophora gossypiella]|uniref:nose resistant to fluoxetine protein 6-like n=1 Tax=Pectinophora gossypiella TaxID=13191 RepID=UPI00214E3237|nr:nose resistant to fluoxetine protein 6-like [Pectinophora gossypiella]